MERKVVTNIARKERGGGALVEHFVQALDELRRRAEVLDERHDDASSNEVDLGLEIDVHVGASKAVNGLLRISHEPQRVARAALEEEFAKDTPLQLVGVLKLVDERKAETRLQLCRELPSTRAAEGSLHEGEHVIEIEEPLFAFDASEPLLNEWQKALHDRGRQRHRSLVELVDRRR